MIGRTLLALGALVALGGCFDFSDTKLCLDTGSPQDETCHLRPVSVTPAFGPASGGTEVTIVGTGFPRDLEVRFGGETAELISQSPTELVVRTPKHARGLVDLLFRGASEEYGTMPGAFTYEGPPQVQAVSPELLAPEGGTQLALVGVDFVPGMTVRFGDGPALPVDVRDGGLAFVTAPAGQGKVALVSENDFGVGAPYELAYSGGWRPLSLGLVGGSISRVFADPLVPNRVWAATKDAIFRSDDRGDHWRSMSLGLAQAEPLRLTASPVARDTLFAVSRDGQMLRTTNAGESWVRVGRVVSVDRYWAPSGLAADPKDPSRVWASAGRLERSDTGGQRFAQLMIWGTRVLGSTRDAVYVSNGQTLLRMTEDGSSGTALPVASPVTIADGKDRFYVARINAQTTELGVSSDGGESFTFNPIANYPQALVGDPGQPDRIYILSNGRAYVSEDAGKTSTDLGLPGTVQALSVDPRDSNCLYVGTYEAGVLRSFDRGATWEPANTGLTAVAPLGISGSAADPQRLYVAAGTNGVLRSDDGGKSWRSVAAFPTGYAVLASETNPDDVWIAHGGGLSHSLDGGETSTTTLPIYGVSGLVRFGNALYLSTWSQVMRLDDGSSTPVNEAISGVSLAVEGGQLFGVGYSGVSQRVTESSWPSVWTPPQPPAIGVAHYQDQLFTARPEALFVNSVQQGPVPGVGVYSLQALRSTAGGVLLAAENGVWRYTTLGGPWTPVNTGLPSRNVTALYPLGGDRVVAATAGQGLFISDTGGAIGP